MPRGRDGADLAAGQEARARRIGDQCDKPERHWGAAKDARPFGLRLGLTSAAQRRLTVPDSGTASSPLLAPIQPEARRGSRGILIEAPIRGRPGPGGLDEPLSNLSARSLVTDTNPPLVPFSSTMSPGGSGLSRSPLRRTSWKPRMRGAESLHGMVAILLNQPAGRPRGPAWRHRKGVSQPPTSSCSGDLTLPCG
jgi:hypothetical protein